MEELNNLMNSKQLENQMAELIGLDLLMEKAKQEFIGVIEAAGLDPKESLEGTPYEKDFKKMLSALVPLEMASIELSIEIAKAHPELIN